MSLQAIEIPAHDATSAAGPMRLPPPIRFISIGGALSVPSTGSLDSLPESTEAFVAFEQTGSGSRLEEPQSSGSAIMTLRRLTRFTWDQLAQLFGVSRRSLHFWASGKALNASNEQHLHRLLAVISRIDRGTSTENRTLLLTERDGKVPFDLLVNGEYETVLALVGTAQSISRPDLQPLSETALKARAPIPPEDLVGARQDVIHREVGRSRPARAIKRKAE